MVDVIPLKYGTSFKKAFSKTNIFQEFVRDVIGIEIDIDQVHTEYEYPGKVGNVRIKYDLFAEDTNSRTIVEIQHIKEEDFFYRFLYYHFISIIEQVNTYEDYNSPKAVYTVVVLTSVPRDGSVDFSWGQHLTQLIDEYGKTRNLAPHRLIFLNPRLVNDKTPAKVKPWLELINDSLDKKMDEDDYSSPIFLEIINEIKSGTLTSVQLENLLNESSWEMAKDRFRREAHEEGWEEGVEVGREEGVEAGKRQQQEATAKVMLGADAELALIVQATGLSIEEIQKLSQD